MFRSSFTLPVLAGLLCLSQGAPADEAAIASTAETLDEFVALRKKYQAELKKRMKGRWILFE